MRAFSIVLLGSADDQRWPELEQRAGLLSLIGKTSISDFLGIIEGSVGVISVDSFAAHVGLAYSRSVAVLMVEPYSQQRSYPENNPNLRLFPGRDGVEKAVVRFFTTPLEARPEIKVCQVGSARSTSSFVRIPLKVALAHHWLVGMRGGEKVLESLADLFPEFRFTLWWQARPESMEDYETMCGAALPCSDCQEQFCFTRSYCRSFRLRFRG